MFLSLSRVHVRLAGKEGGLFSFLSFFIFFKGEQVEEEKRKAEQREPEESSATSTIHKVVLLDHIEEFLKCVLEPRLGMYSQLDLGKENPIYVPLMHLKQLLQLLHIISVLQMVNIGPSIIFWGGFILVQI